MLETNQMRNKLDNLAKEIKKRVKKHINNDDMIQIREAVLKVIYIKKRNVTR